MKLSSWLAPVLALPLLTFCGGDGNSPNPNPNDNGGDSAGGEGPSGGKSGASTTGGTGTGGSSAGGKPSGGAAAGGQTGQGGEPAQGGSPGIPGEGGDSAGGQGGAAPVGPLTFFDYFHDGSAIRWVNTSGSGKVVDLATPPQAFRFAEGDIDGQGKVTSRRTSVIYLDSGKLYRLDASAYATKPAAPVQVSNLQGISDICFSQVVSNLADRSQSLLWFQYKTSGDCAGIGVNQNLPMVAVPLTASAATPPTVLDYHTRALLTPMGALATPLLITDDQRLIRTKSLSDTTEQQELAAATVIDVEALSLGGSKFLLNIYRDDANYELFVFDAMAHTLSSSLGKFKIVSYPVATGLVQNDTYAFFVGVPAGTTQNHIYRMPVSGASAPVALAGIAPTTPSVQLVGITSDKLIYRLLSPLTAGVYSLPPDADFAAPPAATTLVAKNVYPSLLSETRLFYQDVNLAKVVSLDGSHDEFYSMDGNMSHWLGCTTDAQSDIPASRQKTGNCERVYIQAVGPGSTGGKLISYDANADPGQAFFGSASRGTQEHGNFPDELTEQPMLVDASRSGYNPFQTTSNALVTGTFMTRPTINDPDRFALFYLPDPSQTANSTATFLSPTDSQLWLSRGP